MKSEVGIRSQKSEVRSRKDAAHSVFGFKFFSVRFVRCVCYVRFVRCVC